MASAVGSLELGEVAKQVKEGAVLAHEATEKKEAAKKAEAKTKNWLQRNWKKVAAVGVGGTVVAGGLYAGYKVTEPLRSGAKVIDGILGAPLQMLAQGQQFLQDLIPQLDPSNLKNLFPELPFNLLSGKTDSEASLNPLTEGFTKSVADISALFGNIIKNPAETLGLKTDTIDVKSLFPSNPFEVIKKTLPDLKSGLISGTPTKTTPNLLASVSNLTEKLKFPSIDLSPFNF